MEHYRILACCAEEQVCQLAELVLQQYATSEIKLLAGPHVGLVMLRVRESVADSVFNAGEALVTEVKLELNGQFGFGMVIGNSPRRAMAVALVDAALRVEDAYSTQLRARLAQLAQDIERQQRQMRALSAMTKVEFERM
jgi:alpha-D-ribose 1-methylphosphonate 5-triphosphate synthase subunit PhnG